MSLYRLLRNNKETGPFSEEEMIAHGFKPYDLIWVEGRSAGWRYPSEIPAFKAHAPAVEEQPYDRFFRKEPPQQHFAFSRENTIAKDAVTTQPVVQTSVPPAPTPPLKPAPAKSPVSLPDITVQPEALQGKKIHVTLPSGNTVNLQNLVEQSAAAAEEPRSEYAPKPAPVQAKPKPAEPVAAAPAIESKPLPEYKPVYAAATSAARPSLSWGLIAASFIGIATLVGLGIMIGINVGRDKKDNGLVQTQPAGHRNPADMGQNAAVNAPTTASPVDNMHTSLVAMPDEAALPHAPAETQPVKTIVKTIIAQPDKNAAEKNLPKASDNNGADKPKPKEEAVVAREAAPKPTLNIGKDLFIQTNNFKTGAFGGISSLECTVVNNSRLPLETVEVEIDYVQANSKVYKTEKLLFKDVPANAQITLPAPSSSRGIKIIGRVVKADAAASTVKS
jgi:hypothetical protein